MVRLKEGKFIQDTLRNVKWELEKNKKQLKILEHSRQMLDSLLTGAVNTKADIEFYVKLYAIFRIELKT